MKPLKLTAAFLIVMLLLLIGCSADSSQLGRSAVEMKRIALITMDTDYPNWETIKQSAEEKAQQEQISLSHFGPYSKEQTAEQIQVLESCVEQQFDGVILIPGDENALVSPVKKAKDAGIPVVLVDTGISEAVYDSWITTDNIDAGKQCAKLMSDSIGAAGKIAVINFDSSVHVAVDREIGFTNEIKSQYTGIEIVGVRYCNNSMDAEKQATQMISDNPDLQGIWAVDAQATAGVLRAVQNSQKAGQIKIIGFDNFSGVGKELKDGAIHGVAVQMPSLMGIRSIELINNLIDGKKPDMKNIYIGVTLVTPGDLDKPDMLDLLDQ